MYTSGGDGIHQLYDEINALFITLGTVARVCLLVALIVLAGAATRWFNARAETERRHTLN